MICALYIPVVTTGYLSYGDSIRDSIIESIQTHWIQQAINILITIHCTYTTAPAMTLSKLANNGRSLGLLTITLLANPLNQEIEELLGAPQSRFFTREGKAAVSC